MQSADLLELHDDLSRECSRLHKLVKGLSDLGQRLDDSADAVEASALRLHSFYTGIERMLLLISRMENGGALSKGGMLAPAPVGTHGDGHRHQAGGAGRGHTAGAAGVFPIPPFGA